MNMTSRHMPSGLHQMACELLKLCIWFNKGSDKQTVFNILELTQKNHSRLIDLNTKDGEKIITSNSFVTDAHGIICYKVKYN